MGSLIFFSFFGITIVLKLETLEKPWRVCGFALVWGICFQFLYPTGVFLIVHKWHCRRLLHNRVVRLFMSVTGAKRSQNKPNGLLLSV